MNETKLKWVTNVPFSMVPYSIVSQFNGHRFSISEFYESDIWRFPEHWNAGLFFEDRMIAFIYGTYDPLERDLFMKRLAADPEFQMGIKNNLIQMVLNEVENIARQKGAKIIWTMVSRKGFYRKRAGRGKINRDKFILENENF